MKGIKGYSTPMPGGGVHVDTQGMLVDLITIYKAGIGGTEANKADFLKWAAETFDEVKGEVTIPKRSKN